MRAAVLVAILVAGTSIFSTVEAGEFHGYPCTDDCSGHEAGYEWAERKSIDSVEGCGGNSNSFIEGCRAYVEENSHTEDASGTTAAPDENTPPEE